MRRAILIVVAALLGLPANAAPVTMGNGYGALKATRDISAVELGEQFCAARLLDDMSRVADHVGPTLGALIAKLPPDRVPWQSVDVRPTGCLVYPVGPTDTIGVLLEVSYTAPGYAWSDTLNLLRTPSTWLITNVFYGDGGNLRFRLFERAD